ncbi:MAG: hypothetical protein WCO77_12680 [bacterium]
MGYYLTTDPQNAVPPKFWATPKTHTPGSRVKERGFRFYTPETGRWMSRDPIGEQAFLYSMMNYGGVPLQQKVGWRKLGLRRLYGFVGNEPINKVDLYGLLTNDPNGGFVWPKIPDGWDYVPDPDPKGSGLLCALLNIGDAKQQGKDHGWRYAHCLASCRIGKACGTQTAQDVAIYKEIMDAALCALSGGNWDGHCHSAFQPSDFQDNFKGRKCPSDKSCESQCAELKGAREAPGGPMDDLPTNIGRCSSCEEANKGRK